jgi:iron complex transport system permease protein
LRTRTAIIVASPLLVGALALFVGAYGLSPATVLRILAGAGEGEARSVVIDIRLPRILLAALAGGSLAVSGVTLQGVFRNPLIDPYLLGISAGAALGCAVSIGILPWLPLPISAFAGGCAAAAFTLAVARSQGGLSRLALVLSGVVVSALFTALLSIIKLLVEPMKLQGIVFWLMGSFAMADWRQVRIVGLGVLLGLAPIFMMRWRLNALSMGDEEAQALGVNVGRERFVLIAASTLAVALAVSTCGIVGWVGLMAPHLVRTAIGSDHRRLVPLSFAGGAAFLVAADTVARSLGSTDLPVGIVTAIAGAPFFIVLMMRKGAEGWQG